MSDKMAVETRAPQTSAGEVWRKTAPYQCGHSSYSYSNDPQIPWSMHLRAYEVYCHVHCPQKALAEGGCRGGFGVQELFSFLYAGNYPKEEWQSRVDEADALMEGPK